MALFVHDLAFYWILQPGYRCACLYNNRNIIKQTHIRRRTFPASVARGGNHVLTSGINRDLRDHAAVMTRQDAEWNGRIALFEAFIESDGKCRIHRGIPQTDVIVRSTRLRLAWRVSDTKALPNNLFSIRHTCHTRNRSRIRRHPKASDPLLRSLIVFIHDPIPSAHINLFAVRTPASLGKREQTCRTGQSPLPRDTKEVNEPTRAVSEAPFLFYPKGGIGHRRWSSAGCWGPLCPSRPRVGIQPKRAVSCETHRNERPNPSGDPTRARIDPKSHSGLPFHPAWSWGPRWVLFAFGAHDDIVLHRVWPSPDWSTRSHIPAVPRVPLSEGRDCRWQTVCVLLVRPLERIQRHLLFFIFFSLYLIVLHFPTRNSIRQTREGKQVSLTVSTRCLFYINNRIHMLVS